MRPSHTLQSLGDQLCEGNDTPVYFLSIHPIHESIGVGVVMAVPWKDRASNHKMKTRISAKASPGPLTLLPGSVAAATYLLPLFKTKQMNKYFEISIRKMGV